MEKHRNNVGLLRLVFASLVIVSHAPEMIDGDRRREPLTVLFHTLSLGGLSVDAFFLISGYLITQSMSRSSSVWLYLQRRILRIYPAFIVAYIVCVFLLAPIVGGDSRYGLAKTAAGLIMLKKPPYFSGQLAGLPYPSLNGSMWTIAYEFRCYLLVALLSVVGLLRRRYFVLVIATILLSLSVMITFGDLKNIVDAQHPWHINAVIGENSNAIQLTAVFFAGACGYLFWNEIQAWLTGRVAAICAVIASVLLFIPHVAEAGLVVFGGVALFWLAFKARLGRIQRINDDWDISYGCYLYGWPVAIAILYFNRGISPWLLAGLSLPIALAFGAASWWGVEKWTKDLARSRSNRPHARGQKPEIAKSPM